MNKNYIVSIIVLLVLAGGYFLYQSQFMTTKVLGASASNPQMDTGATGQTQNQTTIIDYTPQGFMPNTITVKPGTTVTFVNQDTDPFWPASNPHPIHTDLPGFDAKKQIQPGGSYSYTFSKVGTWGYHNHLEPNNTGKVIVQP